MTDTKLQKVLLLWSQYSRNCQQLIEGKIKPMKLDFIESICIDSPTVRKILLDDQNIKVSMVPAIILQFSNNQIGKYEGAMAFNWIDNMIEKKKLELNINNGTLIQQSQPTIPQESMFQSQISQQTEINNRLKQRLNNVVTTTDMLASKEVGGTLLSTLMEEENSEDENFIDQQGFDLNERQSIPPMPRDQEQNSQIPVNVGSKVQKQGLSILEQAKQMATQRENTDDKINSQRSLQ